MAVLLDTTVLIDALRGREARWRILRLREADETPYVCAVNVEELTRGIRREEERSLQTLLDGLRMAALNRRQGEVAGQWRRSFALRGITLSQSDCLVAAAALGVGARLVTGNPKDFPMRELLVEHWPVGR